MFRRFRGLLAGAVVAVALVTSTARAEIAPPADWPVNPAMQPSLDTWPNAVRLAGDNRFQTGLAAALTLRGTGGATSYPFGSPDTAASGGSYGLGSCPRAVIVVAGDNPADALAASSLSDPTGNSSEPYLRISTSADQVFDPVGDFRRVDTDFAPILVTTSSRQGATQLNLATRLAAQDLRNGACTQAREAIVVGGTSAVPIGVENELVSIGYERIFRVAGTSRYATARAVAESLGTSAAPAQTTACTDPTANDGSTRMSFYANSVVEYRADAQTCVLLEKTVVLADGTVGADALAAGWWTSYWQVPMLLHDGTGELTASTAAALQTLSIDNIIVLGGTSRISDEVAQQAAALATATLTRVNGTDRYATSVLMAERFGGWYATGNASDVAGSQLCIAASTGGTPTQPGLGWADALAAGPWCARSAAATRNAPVRALTPSNGAVPALTTAAQALVRPARDAVPVILVPVGAATVPTTVSSFVANTFRSAGPWCTSTALVPSCNVPGFVIVFGGSTIVPDAVVSALSTAVSGGTASGDRTPTLAGAFVTNLDLGPVYASPGVSGTPRLCAARGSYTQARWLVASAGSTTSYDLYAQGRYATDADGTTRTPGTGSPACAPVTVGTANALTYWSTGLAGQRSATSTQNLAPSSRFALSSALTAASPSSSSGVDSANDASAGGSTVWTYTISSPPQTASVRGISSLISLADVTIVLRRGTNGTGLVGPDTFDAAVLIYVGSGVVEGSISGEAILEAGVWKLRGRAEFGGQGFPGAGGFSADITVGAAGLGDDQVVWNLDGAATDPT